MSPASTETFLILGALTLVSSGCDRACSDRAHPNGLLVHVKTDLAVAREARIDLLVNDWAVSVECPNVGDCSVGVDSVPSGWEVVGQSVADEGEPWTVSFSVRETNGNMYLGPDELQFFVFVDGVEQLTDVIQPNYEVTEDDGRTTCGTYEFATVEYETVVAD